MDRYGETHRGSDRPLRVAGSLNDKNYYDKERLTVRNSLIVFTISPERWMYDNLIERPVNQGGIFGMMEEMVGCMRVVVSVCNQERTVPGVTPFFLNMYQ